jgi:peptidoglycan/LPS O-acetylase OafA/YrhL
MGADGRPPSYFSAFDGLRTAVCTGVVFAHAFPHSAVLGRLALECVSVFFSLSGFLITTLLLEERGRNGRIDLVAFYIRRTLRIWPVYFAAIGVTVLGAFLLGERFLRPLGFNGTPGDLLDVLPSYLVFLGNWNQTPTPSSIVVLWSISVEEQFYLLFPLCVVLSRATRPALFPALVGIAISIAARAGFLLTGRSDGLEFNTFSHGEHLLFGALLAQVVYSAPAVAGRIRAAFGGAAQILLFSLCLAFLVFVGQRLPEGGVLFNTFRFTVSALLSTAIVALFAFGSGPLVAIARQKIPAYLGKLTYGAYAFHILPLAAIWGLVDRAGVPDSWAGVVRGVLGVPAAFLVAFVVYHLFERRLNQLRSRFRPETPFRSGFEGPRVGGTER